GIESKQFIRICSCRRLTFFFSSRRRHTRFDCDWSSDVCSSDLHPAEIYADLARLLGAETDRPSWPEDPPAKLRLATASLPLEALRSVADFSAYLAMANPPPRTRPRIGFDTRS